jgi:hypothetical protein
MKQFVAICLLSQALLSLAGCQPQQRADAPQQASRELAAQNTSSGDAPPHPHSPALLVNRYQFSFEWGAQQFFLTDTTSGQVWRLQKQGKGWDPLPPLPAAQ